MTRRASGPVCFRPATTWLTNDPDTPNWWAISVIEMPAWTSAALRRLGLKRIVNYLIPFGGHGLSVSPTVNMGTRPVRVKSRTGSVLVNNVVRSEVLGGEAQFRADFARRVKQAIAAKVYRDGGEDPAVDAMGRALHVGPRTVKRWRSGETQPKTLWEILKLAEYCGVDPGWLAFGARTEARPPLAAPAIEERPALEPPIDGG